MATYSPSAKDHFPESDGNSGFRSITSKIMLKKAIRILRYVLFLAITVCLAMEMAFRHQWIDFYATEWRALNPTLQPPGARKKILVLGDSFSAQPFSYVQVLRDSMPDCAIYNGAVGGTGIREAVAITRERLREITPDVLIYQVYVGNDLWDLRKRVSGEASWLRRAYWQLSDRLLFLRYINYKSGQMRANIAGPTAELKEETAHFSPAVYSPREKMLFRADPRLIEHSVLLNGNRASDMTRWLNSMDALLGLLPPNCRVLVLMVPHCAQVSSAWRDRMQALGSAPVPAEVGAAQYPMLIQTLDHFRDNDRVHVLSPLPAFQAETGAGSRIYYENDPHLSPTGHRLLGKIVWEEFVRIIH